MKAICGERAHACICHKEPSHVEQGDRVHKCDPERCTGEWEGAYDTDTFKVRHLPFPVGEAIPWPDGLLED